MPQQGTHAMVSAPIAPPPPQPARGGGQATRGGGYTIRGRGQSVIGHPRGGGHVGGAYFCCYAFAARLEAESSDAVIKGTISVCHRDASVLFDLVSTYSYVSSYFASHWSIPRDSLDVHVSMSTPVEDSIVVDRVYKSCILTLNGYDIIVDILLLDMVILRLFLIVRARASSVTDDASPGAGVARGQGRG
ncbi:uncharacterized protein [Nicotiana tomentosiformis]|uniref:uncharacterized protein n=1 Tax=Nicotiana tomentosiformis TaxID=4098 RepID=UPI00388CDDFE